MTVCEVCEQSADGILFCGYDDQPMLAFCPRHFVEHLRGSHPRNEAAQLDADEREKELQQ